MVRLCSTSKTRAKILNSFNIEFIQSAIDFNEDSIKEQVPKNFVYQAAKGKLANAIDRYTLDTPLLVADTVIEANGKIIRKAKNKEEAKKLLLAQSGNSIFIISALIYKAKGFEFIDISSTKYTFKEFEKEDLQNYLDSLEWQGKAGACMVEGFCKKYIKEVVGLESTAMGLQAEKLIPWLEFNKKLSNIRQAKAKPFIKWVGGKRGLLDQIIPLFSKEFNNYHEPFLGGGAVFFELYSKGLLNNKKAFLSDINKELINTYIIVRDKPYELIKNLENYKKRHSKEFYYEIRELDRKDDYHKLSNLKKATRFIYLNKTCFNGLYRVNKKGYFNTPIGSCKNPNIADNDTILTASEALQNTIIKHQSFQEVLNEVQKDDLVYFDPPYYPLNETSNFTSYDSNCFLEEEQFNLYELFDKLSTKGVKIVQSNSDTEFIKELYKSYNISIVNANRFINSKSSGRGKINEVLIRSKV